MKHILILVIFVNSFLMIGCKDKNSGEAPAAAISAVDAKDEPLGNFIVVNQAEEDIYVSSSPSFSPDADVLFKLSGLSSTLNLNRYFDNENKLVRLYALRSSDVEAFREERIKPVASLDILVSEGGTFSPFGSSSTYEKFGELRLCNRTGKVLAFTFNDMAGPIEGMIGRTACNMPIALPARGYLDVYFLDASTLALESQWTDIVADGSMFRFDLGEKSSSTKPSKLKIRSRLSESVQVVDSMSAVALNNSLCDLCPYLPKNTTGEFELTAYSDYFLEIRNLDGQVIASLTDVVLLGSGQEIVFDLVYENGEAVLVAVNVDVPEISAAEITSFSGYCSTYSTSISDSSGELKCTFSYRGDFTQVESLGYELVDIDGDYILEERVGINHRIITPVTRLVGNVSVRLKVSAVDGNYYESAVVEIQIG